MFNSIKENVSGEIIEKKSRFIANIFYIESESEAEDIIKEIKKEYYDARHNCFAYIIDRENISKFSDDGEPSGTAGVPILNILKGRNLSNILVIVTRYFGGTLLGTGGLVRAYSDATIEALKNADIITKIYGKVIKIELEYKNLKSLEYHLKKEKINIVDIKYSEKIDLSIEVTKEEIKKINNMIDNKIILVDKIEVIEEKYISKNV
ncbi:MAG: YigZ family protein [Clostridia bacterium]|nr:YigZ family protein [Clostridia bacterium]